MAAKRPCTAPNAEHTPNAVMLTPDSGTVAAGKRGGMMRMPSTRLSVRGVPRQVKVEGGSTAVAAEKPTSPRLAEDTSGLKAGQMRRQLAQGQAHPSMRRSPWFTKAEPKVRPGQLPPATRGVTGIANSRAALVHVGETFDEMNQAANELEEIEADLTELQSDVHASRIAAGGAAPEGTLRYDAAFATGGQMFDAMDGAVAGSLPRTEIEELLRADTELRNQLARARSDQTRADWECLNELLTASDEGGQASETCTTQLFHDLWAEAGLDVGGSGVDDAQSLYDVITDTVRRVDGHDRHFTCARAALCLKRHKAFLDSLAIARVKLLSRNWMAFLVQVTDPHNRRSDHLSRREFSTLWAQSGLGHFLLVDAPMAAEEAAVIRRASSEQRPSSSGQVILAPKPPAAPRASSEPAGRRSGDPALPSGDSRGELPPPRPQQYLGKADSRRLRGQGWFTMTNKNAAFPRAGGALNKPAPPRVDYKILLDQQRQDHTEREASLQQYHSLLDHVARAKRRNAELLRESYIQLGLIDDDRPGAETGGKRGSLSAAAVGLPQGIGGVLHAITPARPNTPLQQVTRRPHRLTGTPVPPSTPMDGVAPRHS